jgi:hypothetical protein
VDSSQELDAMRAVASALDAASDDARARIVAWAASRYGVRAAGAASWRTSPAGETGSARTLDASSHQLFPEFFDAAAPRKESEKALVAGYWLQRYRGMLTFDAATVNRELKYLGHAVRNITAAFDDLRQEKPALAAQTSKGGPAQQARKKYIITDAGEKAVLEMLAASGERAQ